MHKEKKDNNHLFIVINLTRTDVITISHFQCNLSKQDMFDLIYFIWMSGKMINI